MGRATRGASCPSALGEPRLAHRSLSGRGASFSRLSSEIRQAGQSDRRGPGPTTAQDRETPGTSHYSSHVSLGSGLVNQQPLPLYIRQESRDTLSFLEALHTQTNVVIGAPLDQDAC